MDSQRGKKLVDMVLRQNTGKSANCFKCKIMHIVVNARPK